MPKTLWKLGLWESSIMQQREKEVESFYGMPVQYNTPTKQALEYT